MLKGNLLDLISKSKVKEAFIILRQNTGYLSNLGLKNDFLVQSARFHELEKKIREGQITHENEAVSRNKIIAELLNIVNQIPEGHLGGNLNENISDGGVKDIKIKRSLLSLIVVFTLVILVIIIIRDNNYLSNRTITFSINTNEDFQNVLNDSSVEIFAVVNSIEYQIQITDTGNYELQVNGIESSEVKVKFFLRIDGYEISSHDSLYDVNGEVIKLYIESTSIGNPEPNDIVIVDNRPDPPPPTKENETDISELNDCYSDVFARESISEIILYYHNIDRNEFDTIKVERGKYRWALPVKDKTIKVYLIGFSTLNEESTTGIYIPIIIDAKNCILNSILDATIP